MQKSESGNPLVKKLFLCAQIAEHKSEMARKHGRDEDGIFSALSDEEREDLSGLLAKLENAWAREHAEFHKKAAADQAK